MNNALFWGMRFSFKIPYTHFCTLTKVCKCCTLTCAKSSYKCKYTFLFAKIGTYSFYLKRLSLRFLLTLVLGILKFFEGACWVQKVSMGHPANKKHNQKCPLNEDKSVISLICELEKFLKTVLEHWIEMKAFVFIF